MGFGGYGDNEEGGVALECGIEARQPEGYMHLCFGLVFRLMVRVRVRGGTAVRVRVRDRVRLGVSVEFRVGDETGLSKTIWGWGLRHGLALGVKSRWRW